MQENKYEEKIKEIDEFLFEAYKKVDMYQYLTPSNLIEENNIFLENYRLGIEYNPIYNYENIHKEYDSNYILNKICNYKEELEQIEKEDVEEYKTLINREKSILEELEDMIILCTNIGNNDSNIDYYSKKIYGQPDEELIKNARIILEKDSKIIENLEYTAQDCKEIFEKVLKELNLNWNIIIKEIQSSKISVISEKKIISINGKIKFSKNDLKRLIVHEIGTHVLRAENGNKQQLKMFSIDMGKILYTEEGLATINEEDCGVLDRRTLKIYAGRVLAISECMCKSFYEAFQTMLKYFSEDDAMYIVSRIKRGIKNTKEYNVFVKDYVYLDGYYKVKKYLETHEKQKLYVGTIGINEMEEIEKLVQRGILNETSYYDLNKLIINI